MQERALFKMGCTQIENKRLHQDVCKVILKDNN